MAGLTFRWQMHSSLGITFSNNFQTDTSRIENYLLYNWINSFFNLVNSFRSISKKENLASATNDKKTLFLLSGLHADISITCPYLLNSVWALENENEGRERGEGAGGRERGGGLELKVIGVLTDCWNPLAGAGIGSWSTDELTRKSIETAIIHACENELNISM